MSETRGTKLTYAGLQLLAKCQTGQALHFTRVAMGDGRVEAEQDIRQLAGLVNPKLNLPIKSVRVTGVGTTIMETELKNVNLAEGFFAREVGIFAQDGDTEILYAYRNTGDDSEYIPAGGGSEVWNLIYDVVTVVDQATNITANINGDIAYVTRLDFNEHLESAAPHPNFLNIGNEVETAEYFNVGVAAAGDKLNRISMDKARRAILGDEASTIPLLRSRIGQLEREQANIALKLEAEHLMPDCNMLLAEDFKDPDSIDQLSVKVTSCAAGDDSIDVATDYGLIVGSWYWITDGVHAEYAQIKSIIKNGDVRRIIFTAPLRETYDIPATSLYRTTAWISPGGVVYGSGDVRGYVWSPGVVWQGTMAGATEDVTLNTNENAADEFDLSGDVQFSADNMITLGGK